MQRLPVRAGLPVVLVVAVLAISPVFIAATGGSGPNYGAPPVPVRSAVLEPDQGSSATLSANRTAVVVGESVRFLLNIAPVNCSPNAPPSETVALVTFHLGDGFSFDEATSDCVAGPSPEGPIPLVYSYRNPGVEHVSATVFWEDGSNASTNSAVVTVSPAASGVLPVLEVWLWGAPIGTSIILVVCFLVRRRLPRSPVLPPRQV